MSEFEQIVRVTPAFDKRDDDPKKNYGIGACLIWFILKGPKGAIQFQIGTDWYLPHTQRSNRVWQHDHNTKFDVLQPQGWDVGYHSLEPRYEEQQQMDCDLFDCGHCYYDGSSLQADEWVPDFLAGGTEWLWPKLESVYRETFELGSEDDK